MYDFIALITSDTGCACLHAEFSDWQRAQRVGKGFEDLAKHQGLTISWKVLQKPASTYEMHEPT